MIRNKGEAIDWYLSILRKGKISEEELKNEASQFFKLNSMKNLNKQTVCSKLKNFNAEYESEKRKIMRKILKEKNGSGRDYTDPPFDYDGNNIDPKKKKKKFLDECRNEVLDHVEYLTWRSNPFVIFSSDTGDSISNQKTNILVEKSCNDNQLTIKKQHSNGICETEKTFIVNNQNGIQTKKIIKETYANITTRKRKNKDKENSNILGETHRKRTRSADSIINHLNENNKKDKAIMMARIIDNEGEAFGKEVKNHSHALKANNAFSVEETHELQVATNSSDYLWRQTTSAFTKTMGYSPFASAKKVEKYRSENLCIDKSDWIFERKDLYKYKQGKMRAKPEDTAVIRVKDLPEYITKIAKSEKSDLDLKEGKLLCCFDADAGGGRFVTSFGFLNRKDESVIIHPVLMFEGSDCRKNLEMTIGAYTEAIKSFDGSIIDIDGLQVEINFYGLFDLAALNLLLGKQNHSSTFPCAWTDVQKQHLKASNHKHIEHTESNCKDITFLSLKNYEEYFTKHAYNHEKKDLSKTGKHFGSVVGHNLLPLKSIKNYVPPIMHIIMGETNNIITELKHIVIELDNEGTARNDHHKNATEKIEEMYEEKESYDEEWSSINVAHMVVLNDQKRLECLLNGKEKEASAINIDNFNNNNKKKRTKKSIVMLKYVSCSHMILKKNWILFCTARIHVKFTCVVKDLQSMKVLITFQKFLNAINAKVEDPMINGLHKHLRDVHQIFLSKNAQSVK